MQGAFNQAYICMLAYMLAVYRNKCTQHFFVEVLSAAPGNNLTLAAAHDQDAEHPACSMAHPMSQPP